MSRKTFSTLAGVIFVLIAAAHLIRLVFKWEVILAGWQVPLWTSAVAFVLSASPAYEGFRVSKDV